MRHHYDVSNEFFALFLDESMTYSCALFSRELDSLEGSWGTIRRRRSGAADARGGAGGQARAGLPKLELQEGERVLDVGCGWGSFVIHAAANHGSGRSASPSPPPRPSWRAARRRGRPGGPRRDPRRRLPRSRARRALRRDRLDRDGRARGRQPDRRLRRAARAACWKRGAAAQPRHRAPAPRRRRGGAVLRALRVPRRGAPAPLARAARARTRRASSRRTSRALRRTTSRRSATGSSASTPTASRPSAWPAASACASGGSTCAPRATGSPDRLHLDLPGTRPRAP